jgi:hypothetical protein
MAVPQHSWFLLQPPSDLHGLGHTARVLTWACVLTRGTPWFDTVLWAAACHDLRRCDDFDDPQHGFRAGSWVRRTLPGLLRRTPEDLELVALACDWHVCPDDQSEWDHPTLWLLKDADGLDRARLYDLDPSFLRRPEALRLVDLAHALFAATDEEEEPQAIWRVAGSMGLPVAELVEWAAWQEANLAEGTEGDLPDATGVPPS